MNKVVPLHSLVICVGGTEESRFAAVKNFPKYEILRARDIALELLGHAPKSELMGALFGELRHRAALKLELGERVVIDAPNLRKEDRSTLAHIGQRVGVPIFYLVCTTTDEGSTVADRGYELDALSGEGVAEVIDTRSMTASPVSKDLPTLTAIREKWAGITVIGDIHGMHQSLQSALAWARARNHYIIFLGDVVDYGHGTLDVADEVYRLVMRGDAEIIIGNHERKIARWIAQLERNGRTGTIRLSSGNRVTTDRLAELSSIDRGRWQGRFKGLIARSQIIRTLGNITMTHASVHPDYWTNQTITRDVETYATFGEFETIPDGEGSRCYSWIEAIPKGKLAIVGHDIRSFVAPFIERNSADAASIFLDTGSGKSGLLSSVDLKFDLLEQLRIANFNMY